MAINWWAHILYVVAPAGNRIGFHSDSNRIPKKSVRAGADAGVFLQRFVFFPSAMHLWCCSFGALFKAPGAAAIGFLIHCMVNQPLLMSGSRDTVWGPGHHCNVSFVVLLQHFLRTVMCHSWYWYNILCALLSILALFCCYWYEAKSDSNRIPIGFQMDSNIFCTVFFV